MSRDELLAALAGLKHEDPETAHMEADELLLRYIGDEIVTQAFEAIPKWYA